MHIPIFEKSSYFSEPGSFFLTSLLGRIKSKRSKKKYFKMMTHDFLNIKCDNLVRKFKQK